MRVVVDTNVLVSGIFFDGAPGRIISAWRDGKLELVVSEEILDEYRAVCERISDRYQDVDIRPLLFLIASNSTVVSPRPLPEPVSNDPDDDKFLACAVSGNAKIVVSGDKDLLSITGYRGIAVIKPRKFLDHFLSRP